MNENQTTTQNKGFFQKYIFAGSKKLFGSVLTMVVGLGLLGSAAAGSNPPEVKGIAWAMIIGGAVCYSAKKIRLGLVKQSALRLTLEILGLILALFFATTSGSSLSIITALWVLIAYLVIKFKKKNKSLSS
jgi:hypothetical protein